MNADESTRKFYAFVWPALPMTLRVARMLVGDESEAEDLAQETMIRAFRGIEGFAEGTNLKAWLLTIMRRVRIDRMRSPATATDRAVSLGELDYEVAGTSHDPIIDAADFSERPSEVLNAFSDQQVIEALKALPEEIRLTLLLVDVEGVEHKDAAEILSVPVGTIKSRAHRGRSMLRTALLPLAKEMRLVKE